MALRENRERLLIGDLKYHVGYTSCILEGIQGEGILRWKITYFLENINNVLVFFFFFKLGLRRKTKVFFLWE